MGNGRQGVESHDGLHPSIMPESQFGVRLISYWKRLGIAELLNCCYTETMQSKVIINERGALTIPAKMRKTFGIKANDELIIEDTEQGLLLRPAFSVPVEIYTEDRINEFASDEEAIGRLLPHKK